jgi:glycosyltransferase involved in cell wall biosynthesis
MKKYKLNELVQATGQAQTIGEATTSPTAVVPTTTEQPVGGAFKKIENDQVVIDMDIIRKSNIFFATPCYGGQITDQYFLSMFRLTQELIKYNINFRITTLRNESLVPRARNILNAMFLEAKECTHLMFIDADIEFEPESIIRMLAMDKDLITGAYPKKTLPVDYAINLKFADEERTQVKVDMGAVEVLDASTGFWLMKREVVDRMIEGYPELFYLNDSSIDPKFNEYCYSFFDTIHDPDDNRYLSEDYTFCRRWQKIGGQIWLDPNTKLNHVGSYTFEGNVNKIFNWEAVGGTNT